MNKEKLLTLIQSPYITEKATSVGSLNQVVMVVPTWREASHRARGSATALWGTVSSSERTQSS